MYVFRRPWNYAVQLRNLRRFVPTVDSGNNAPTWTDPGAQTLEIDTAYSLALSDYTEDLDADSLTYSVNSGSLPAGISLNTSTGDVTGTPTTKQAASTVQFRVDDGTDTADQNVDFTVNDPYTYVHVLPQTVIRHSARYH